MICKICRFKGSTLHNTLPFFKVYHCPNCGVYFAGHNFSVRQLKTIYGDSYFQFWEGQNSTLSQKNLLVVENMKKKTFAKYLDLIGKHGPLKGKKLLDIGCATGYLLEVAREKGCQCFGIEVSPAAAKQAGSKFPGRIFQGSLEEASYSDNSLDIITMIDVIEHVADPVKVFRKVYKMLKPDGYLLIITPNINSFWSKILGKKWTEYKKEHVFYFTPSSLSFITNRTGFKNTHCAMAPKYLTLDYIYSHFKIYPTPVLGIVSRLFLLLPRKIQSTTFPINAGSFMVLLQKEPEVKN